TCIELATFLDHHMYSTDLLGVHGLLRLACLSSGLLAHLLATLSLKPHLSRLLLHTLLRPLCLRILLRLSLSSRGSSSRCRQGSTICLLPRGRIVPGRSRRIL